MKNKSKIQVVIPMAGIGSRFKEAGYSTTKPLLPIGNYRMFEIVISNLMSDFVDNFVIISAKDFHLQKESKELENKLGRSVRVIEIDYVTEGPAETVALAKNLLDLEAPLVIANSDQYINFDLTNFYELTTAPEYDGAVLTMRDNDPKWSYAEVDDLNQVTRIVEKQVISEFATVGIYGFKRASHFFEALNEMKQNNDRVNNEFYVAPCYTYLAQENLKIANIDMGDVGDVMFGLGTPEDYEKFLTTNAYSDALQAANRTFEKS